MRIPVLVSSRRTSSNVLQLLLLTAYVQPAFSIPHTLAAPQSSFESLQLPACALTCFVNSILTDGCANETDFACHCASGNIIGEATACIEQGCDKADEMDAIRKVKAGCGALGGDVGSGNEGGGGGSRGGSSTLASSSSSTSNSEPSPSAAIPTSTTSQPVPSSSGDMSSQATPTPTPIPTPTPSSSSPNSTPSTSTSSSSASPTSSPPIPTDMPLALLPASDQLSAAAKAGISVSVSIFALSIFFALGWYIRRLKRELRAAQRAAAGIPDDVWRSSIATAATPGGIDRQASFARGRRMSRYGRESPVSPLSPRDMEHIITVTDNGYGVLKKKRGHVLSVVVEREEEDGSLMDRIIREPVPGQREGLSGPLELDGEYTGIVELPIAITPRERSFER